MSESTGHRVARTIEAASTWLIVLRDDNVTTADKVAFADWLLQSPTHIREFLWCDQLWAWLREINWKNVAAATDVVRGGERGVPASDLH